MLFRSSLQHRMHLDGRTGDFSKGFGGHLLVGLIISCSHQKLLRRRHDGPGMGAVNEGALPKAGEDIDTADGHEIGQYLLPDGGVGLGVYERSIRLGR